MCKVMPIAACMIYSCAEIMHYDILMKRFGLKFFRCLPQVHSEWMAHIPIFKGATKLPTTFFVRLVKMLEPRLFCPFEAVIEPHFVSDVFYVVQSGIVMADCLKMVTTGQSFGDDALYVFRCVSPSTLE